MRCAELTSLLDAVKSGDERAAERFVEATYPRLRALARARMQQQRIDHTLQPTALANEAIVRILSSGALSRSSNGASFFALAAYAMRSVLVDHARRAAARCPSHQRVPFEGDAMALQQQTDIDLLSLDEALQRLKTFSQRQHEIVMLRFFGGWRLAEIAKHLQISLSTVEKDWAFARAWLRKTLDEG